MKRKFAALFLLLALLLAVSALADTQGLLTLPAGTTVIEEEAFAGLTSATEFDLPASVTQIGAGAFRGAGSGSAQLRYYFPTEGLTVAPGAFDSCRATVKLNGTELPRIYYTVSDSGATVTGSGGNLTDVVIPDTLGGKPVVAIGKDAFSGQSAMTRVMVPDTVVSLGQNAFRNCQALTEINLPAGVTALPNDAFFGCYALAEIDLTGINSLGSNALRGCRSLTEVTIPEGITTLPSSLLEDATGLTQVHLPSTLTTINNYAFYNCKALTEIAIPAGVTAIPNGAFQKCSALESVQLPAGVESIAQNAFRECTKLTQINFPAGLTSIGNEAFRDTCVGRPPTRSMSCPTAWKPLAPAPSITAARACWWPRAASGKALRKQTATSLPMTPTPASAISTSPMLSTWWPIRARAAA